MVQITEKLQLTITRQRFLEWYYESGSDQENEELREDLARQVLQDLHENGSAIINIEEIWEKANLDAIRLHFTEQYEPNFDEDCNETELGDLPFGYEIELINEFPKINR